jgi:conjugative relaxase-like TrwC/TraI family protein
VLGIHGVGRDGADYYLSDPARELPVPAPGQWAGSAAAGIGLAGPVDPEEFRRLLQGLHPHSGHPLGSDRVTVAAFDLTFSAPKSASVLFGLGGADTARRIVAAHADAVAGALAYMEQHAVSACRRAGPERAVVGTTGMIAGQFTHAVNRNGDPHLHSHVVMANLVHGVDGRWSACDRRGLSAHRQAAGAVYSADLQAGLTAALGLRWAGAPGHAAEIVGIAPALLGEFSSRAADIRRHMYGVGARSARGSRIAWAATRPAKEPGAPYDVVAGDWGRRARAADAPLDLGRSPARTLLDEHRFAAVLSLTPHGGARRRDVVAAFGGAAPDGIAASELQRLVARWVPPAGIGVTEPLHPRRAFVPAPHLLCVFGPRPIDPAAHEVWVGAAAVMDAYRDRWGLDRATESLGAVEAPSVLAALPAARLADHVRTARHVELARAQLGRRDGVGVELGLGR